MVPWGKDPTLSAHFAERMGHPAKAKAKASMRVGLPWDFRVRFFAALRGCEFFDLSRGVQKNERSLVANFARSG